MLVSIIVFDSYLELVTFLAADENLVTSDLTVNCASVVAAPDGTSFGEMLFPRDSRNARSRGVRGEDLVQDVSRLFFT